MKAEIQIVKDLATGRSQPITYLIPENQADLEQLRDMAATGHTETSINPQDELAERDGDDIEMRADALQDKEAEEIRQILKVDMISPEEAQRLAGLEPPSPRAAQELADARRRFWPR